MRKKLHNKKWRSFFQVLFAESKNHVALLRHRTLAIWRHCTGTNRLAGNFELVGSYKFRLDKTRQDKTRQDKTRQIYYT